MTIAKSGSLCELGDMILESRRAKQTDEEIAMEVDARGILDQVRMRGDPALFELTQKFDGVDITAKGLQVSDPEIETAYDQLIPGEKKALEFLRDRIQKVEYKKLQSLNYIHKDRLVTLNNITRPLDSVGCYIPGGFAVYPSTLLMTVVPARVAGVKRVVVCSPPSTKGDVDPMVLAAAAISGVDEVYRIGGAQAIAAMAYGTQSITPVEKVVGPARRFVTIAKMLVSKLVAIDLPAGPSEILILADESADPRLVALDLISQAEHAPDNVSILVTTSERVLRETENLLVKLLPRLERKDIVEQSLLEHGALLLAESTEEAMAFINAFAPEHLELLTRRPRRDAEGISSAGIILIGNNTPVSASDYCLGTNHVLPTSGRARTCSELSVFDYVKRIAIVECQASALRRMLPIVRLLSEREGLPNHYLALQGRFDHA